MYLFIIEGWPEAQGKRAAVRKCIYLFIEGWPAQGKRATVRKCIYLFIEGWREAQGKRATVQKERSFFFFFYYYSFHPLVVVKVK